MKYFKIKNTLGAKVSDIVNTYNYAITDYQKKEIDLDKLIEELKKSSKLLYDLHTFIFSEDFNNGIE